MRRSNKKLAIQIQNILMSNLDMKWRSIINFNTALIVSNNNEV